ncbi:MAG: hypothetical protein KF900_05510 [Bacteroidetes bacterium]|nr:hypothetical protein [Bacteroidota bacterium]
MKFKTILFTLMLAAFGCHAQNTKTGTIKNEVPETFTISKNDINSLLSHKADDVIANNNKYLDKAQVQVVSTSGDMTSMRLKMDYIANAFLFVQVNGAFSTQVFVTTSDKSVFYKSEEKNGNFVLTKCDEEDIISE